MAFKDEYRAGVALRNMARLWEEHPHPAGLVAAAKVLGIAEGELKQALGIDD